MVSVVIVEYDLFVSDLNKSYVEWYKWFWKRYKWKGDKKDI